MQAAAIFSGVKPNVVRLNFDQVKGYEAPVSPLDEEIEMVFESPATQQFDELQAGYERAVTVARSLLRRNEELEAHLKSILDPDMSVLIDLKPWVAEILRKHNPEANTDLETLQRHYVMTAQLVAERLVQTMAKQWALFDHHVLENGGESVAKTRLEMGANIEFTDLSAASITNAKLKMKLGADGINITLPRAIPNGSKSPSEPTLFDEKAFRPTFASDVPEEEGESTDTDVPNIEEPQAEVEAEADPKDAYHAGYGVVISVEQYEGLSEKQQAQVDKWIAIMGGEKGTKTFPTCLKKFVEFEPAIYADDGEKAFGEGKKKTEHDMEPGSGQHYFWRKGYEAAEKASAV